MTTTEEIEAMKAILESVEEVVALLKQLPTNANRQMAAVSLERSKSWIQTDIKTTQ